MKKYKDDILWGVFAGTLKYVISRIFVEIIYFPLSVDESIALTVFLAIVCIITTAVSLLYKSTSAKSQVLRFAVMWVSEMVILIIISSLGINLFINELLKTDISDLMMGTKDGISGLMLLGLDLLLILFGILLILGTAVVRKVGRQLKKRNTILEGSESDDSDDSYCDKC